jgi:hypothetical protein
MSKYNNPKWWTPENDSAWDRVKAAFKRDWDQTKHDLGGKQPDTDQDVDDTVKQAAGKQPIPPRGQPVYETVEPAYRFGYGAKFQYGKKYPKWNADLENELKREWSTTYPQSDWDSNREYVQGGWKHQI